MGDALVAAARAAREQAYCPYSQFAVGAALEGEDGRIYAGCNVENASYGLGICAERSAVSAAVTAGTRRFRRLVVVVGVEPPISPCGACRQVLAEFGPDLVVEGVGPRSSRRWTIAELLPEAFGGASLRRREDPGGRRDE
jgi:cytidine deaminase